MDDKAKMFIVFVVIWIIATAGYYFVSGCNYFTEQSVIDPYTETSVCADR